MRVGIGPANTAGQAYRMAVMLRERGVDAESWSPKPHRLGFPVDRIAPIDYARRYTHLLSWTGTPFPRHPHVAYAYQGSEIRRPSVHRLLEPWSPFGDDAFSAKLEARIRIPRLPAFVATLDLLHFVPGATWLPVLADPADGRPLFRRRKPRVLFAPTSGFMKGSVPSDPAYDLRQPDFLPQGDILRAIAEADVVVGGLRLGAYGGTEIQAMAAGRVVVGHVSEGVRAMLPELPIVEANPDTIRDVLRDIANDPDRYAEEAARGPMFHAIYHDGRFAFDQLADFLR